METAEKMKEDAKRRRIFVYSIFLVAIVFFLSYYGLGRWIFMGVIYSIGISVVVCLLLFYFIWAPNNLFFTFVKEGRGKCKMKGGGFEKGMIQLEEHTFDEECNVVPENEWVKDGKVVEEGTEGARQYKEPQHILGGFRFYGAWPIEDIYSYNFQWSGVTENGEIVHHPKERLDYCLLIDDVYWARVEEAEDKALLPLDVEIVLTIRIINPKKALFKIQNWLEAIINRVKPSIRNAMTKETFEELITKTDAIGKEIYRELNKTEGLFEEFRDIYGIDVRNLGIKKINPPKEYREATLKPWLSEQEARARTSETVGTLIRMMAEETGMSREEIQEQLKKAPGKFIKKHKGVWEKNWDILHRRMAIDGKSFSDIRVIGAQGMERSLLNLVTLWNTMSGRTGTSLGKEKKTPEERRKRVEKILERDEKKYAQKG